VWRRTMARKKAISVAEYSVASWAIASPLTLTYPTVVDHAEGHPEHSVLTSAYINLPDVSS
jgi:hypothetical protein